MDCKDFRRTLSPRRTWEESAKEACNNCNKCKGNFPINPKDKDIVQFSDSSNLLLEIEELINEENAGFEINWHFTNPEYFIFIVQWRKVESEIKEIREQRHQEYIKAHFRSWAKN